VALKGSKTMETVGLVVAFWLSVFGLGLSMSLIEAKQQAREAAKRADSYRAVLRASEQSIGAGTMKRPEENQLSFPERQLIALLKGILDSYREAPEPGRKGEKVQLFLQLCALLRSIEQSTPALFQTCWHSPSFGKFDWLCRHRWQSAQFTDTEVNGTIPVVVEDLYNLLLENIPPH
jgi:hypothetical protein